MPKTMRRAPLDDVVDPNKKADNRVKKLVLLSLLLIHYHVVIIG